MSGEIVKYSNSLNDLSLRKFNSSELNILMTLCQRCKEQNTKEIILTFDEIKELSQLKPKDNSDFIKSLITTNDKLIALRIILRDEEKKITYQFVLFTTFEINEIDKTLTVAINEKFKFILNELDKNFTRFELEEFTSLKSQYSKNLFRFLKQYRSKGYCFLTIDKFREILDIPDSYKMCSIDTRVLKPTIKELSPYFKDLKIKKVRKGVKIDKLEFSFTPEAILKETNNNIGQNTISLDKIEQLNEFDRFLNRHYAIVGDEFNYSVITSIYSQNNNYCVKCKDKNDVENDYLIIKISNDADKEKFINELKAGIIRGERNKLANELKF